MHMYDWLAKQADLRPEITAMVDTATGRRYTYPEFDDRASRFARFLTETGGRGQWLMGSEARR